LNTLSLFLENTETWN